MGTATGDVTCPACEEYTGPMSSVEAHISRLTDDDHAGTVGREYREELEQQESEMPTSGEYQEQGDLLESSDGSTEVDGEDAVEPGGDTSSSAGSSGSGSSAAVSAGAVGAAAVPFVEEVDTKVVVAGVVLAVLVVVLLLSDDSEPSQEPSREGSGSGTGADVEGGLI